MPMNAVADVSREPDAQDFDVRSDAAGAPRTAVRAHSSSSSDCGWSRSRCRATYIVIDAIKRLEPN
jgi:hypothetical protein